LTDSLGNLKHPAMILRLSFFILVFAIQTSLVIQNSMGQIGGEVDPTFQAQVDGPVTHVWPLSGDKLLLAGSFTKVGGTNRPGLARLHRDGSLDREFQPNAVQVEGIKQLKELANGTIAIHTTNATTHQVVFLNPHGKTNGAHATFTTTNLVHDIFADGWLLVSKAPGSLEFNRVSAAGEIDRAFYIAPETFLPPTNHTFRRDVDARIFPDGRIVTVDSLFHTVFWNPRFPDPRLSIQVAFRDRNGALESSHTEHGMALTHSPGDYGTFRISGNGVVHLVSLKPLRITPTSQTEVKVARVTATNAAWNDGIMGYRVSAASDPFTHRLADLDRNIILADLLIPDPSARLLAIQNDLRVLVGYDQPPYLRRHLSSPDSGLKIVRSPDPVPVPLPQPLLLKVITQSTNEVRYQWFRNGVAVTNATNSTLQVPSGTTGSYSVEVSTATETIRAEPALVGEVVKVNRADIVNGRLELLLTTTALGKPHTVQMSHDLFTWTNLIQTNLSRDTVVRVPVLQSSNAFFRVIAEP
jgi:hypothetical protein